MILITGCSGVLGAALLEELRSRYEGVVGIRSAEVDLLNLEATQEFFQKTRPETVFHAAAKVHGLVGNQKFPCDVYSQNIRINTNVVEAARLAGCTKFVGVSTVAAYPDGQPFPISEDALWKGAPHASERAYAHSKRAMLAHLDASKSQYGMDFAYPIVTNLFGPHDRFDEAHGHVIPSLVSKFHRAARTGAEAAVWGTGRAKRDFMYGSDAAAAIVLAGVKHSGPINIASGNTVPIAEVVGYLSAVSGVSRVVWDKTKPDGQLDRSYDISLLKGLGFQPQVSLEQGVEATYRWYASSYPNVRL